MTKIAKTETQELLPADPMVSMIERVAMDPNADIAKLERMLEMKERHDAQSAKKAFDAAFSQASAKFPSVKMSGRNTHNGKDYATLKDILDAVRPILTDHGLALSFSTTTTPEFVTVTAELSHEAGHSKTNSIDLPRDTGPGRNTVQAVGSSQTYGQRYTAQAILGLSLGEDTDDDGNSTGKKEEHPVKRQPSWGETVIQDLPETATAEEKAKAIADAIVAQWGRMKGVKQIHNEWDRREQLIEWLRDKWPEHFSRVFDTYDARIEELKAKGAER